LMSDALVDSRLKASAQPPNFLTSSSTVGGERTLDVSSWRSGM
jgi:hypothetical protein